MLKYILFVLLLGTPVLSATVYEYPADKVLVIIKDDGSVVIREPREMDYIHSETMKDKNTSVKDKIFGNKCHR